MQIAGFDFCRFSDVYVSVLSSSAKKDKVDCLGTGADAGCINGIDNLWELNIYLQMHKLYLPAM